MKDQSGIKEFTESRSTFSMSYGMVRHFRTVFLLLSILGVAGFFWLESCNRNVHPVVAMAPENYQNNRSQWQVSDNSTNTTRDATSMIRYIPTAPRVSSAEMKMYNPIPNPEHLPANLTSTDKGLYDQFKPVITLEQKKQFMKTLELLTDALDSSGSLYYMFGGTLIGSWRHHGMVPWDDDVDIAVNYSDRRAVAALNVSGYTIDTATSTRYKFFSNDAKPIKGYPHWRWPYIDICFFNDTGSKIHVLSLSKSTSVSRLMIMPLTHRPFEHMMLRAPRNPLSIIKSAADKCQTRTYDHMHQRGIKPTNVFEVRCILLQHLYPLVIRDNNKNTNSGVENLKLGAKLLQSFKPKPRLN